MLQAWPAAWTPRATSSATCTSGSSGAVGRGYGVGGRRAARLTFATIDGLRGAELIQVAVRSNEVVLHRAPHASRMIASDVVVAGPAPAATRHRAPTEVAAALFPLPGASVTGVRALPPGTLHLELGDAGYLEVVDSWPTCESYTISIDGTLIVV